MQQRSQPSGGQPTLAVVLKGYPRLSETFIAQELRALERVGFRLRLYSMRHPTDRKRHPVHDEIEAPVSYLPEYLHRAPWRVVRSIWAVRNRAGFGAAARAFWQDLRRDITPNRVRRFGQACVLAAELPDDVTDLYAHFIHTPGSVARYASLITGLPWRSSAHAKDIWTSPDWELAEKLASAEWTTTCTRIGADHLSRLAGEPGRVNLIYHGLDLDRFPPPETDPSLETARDGTSSDDPIRLVSVGRAVPKKGYDVLLAALARLPRDLAWTFTHIGGGSEAKRLKAQAEQLGLADRVIWAGAQAQSAVLDAYRASDLFILPCRIAKDGDRDGLPNVLVEAQSQRLACLSTRISAVPELIIDGQTGRLVPSEDPQALADAIAALASDPATRLRLAAAGEARVRAEFDMHAGIARLAALFPERVRSEPARRLPDAIARDAAE